MTTTASAGRPWTTRRITIWSAVATAVLLLAVIGALVVKNATGMHGVSDEQRARSACRDSVLAQTGITSTTAVFSRTSITGAGDLFRVSEVLEDKSVLGVRSTHAYLCTARRWPGGTFVAENVQIN